MLAERADVRAVLICRPNVRVDHREVERAVAARTRVHADLAAIVSGGQVSSAAKIFAQHLRIGLLTAGDHGNCYSGNAFATFASLIGVLPECPPPPPAP